MESFGDKLRALTFALALHLLCVLALLVGLWWTHETRPVTMPGPVIEATLIGPTAAPKARSGATKARPTPVKPEPAPVKPEPPKPEPPKPEPVTPAKETPTEVQRQDQIEREKVAAIAEQKAEQEKQEQDEKHRQEQVLLDQEQKDRKLKEEQQKQLADIRKQREAADKKVKLEKERLAQLEDRNQEKADQPAQPVAEHEAPQAQTGAAGNDNDGRYAAAIQAAVTQNWNRPDNAEAGLRCVLKITQIPGGDVISVTIGSPCNADPVTRNSIEQAVMKAAPLPYQGYEKDFQRNLNLIFKYDG
jgi:colicin import membrane protein